jgi:hypothetical protein
MALVGQAIAVADDLLITGGGMCPAMEDGDLVPRGFEFPHHMAADKAITADDEDVHGLPFVLSFHFMSAENWIYNVLF